MPRSLATLAALDSREKSIICRVPWGEEASRHIPVLIANFLGAYPPSLARLYLTCTDVYEWYFIYPMHVEPLRDVAAMHAPDDKHYEINP